MREALSDAIPRRNDPVAVVLVCDSSHAEVQWLAPQDVRHVILHKASVVINVHKSGKIAFVKSRYA